MSGVPLGSRRPGLWSAAALCLTVPSLLLPAAAREEPDAFSWTAEIEACSRYIWRGIPWSEGAVVQPAARISGGGWSFGLWANFDREGGPAWGMNEIDLSLSYLKEGPVLTLEPGLNVYVYPGAGGGEDPPTVEAALNSSLRVTGPLSVFLEQALDVGSYPGSYYAEAGLGLDLEVLPEVALEASASQSYGSRAFNRAYWDVSRGMLDAVFLRMALTWAIGGGFFLRARIEEAVLTGRSLREEAGRGSFFMFGLALGVER